MEDKEGTAHSPAGYKMTTSAILIYYMYKSKQ